MYRVCRITRVISRESCFKLGGEQQHRGGWSGGSRDGAGLLGVDCLLIPKGWVGTVGVNNMGVRLGSRGWLSSSLESGWAEKPLQVLWWEMSDGIMSCSWIEGTDGHS